MSLSPARLCVVLVEPTLPENVGAVARAMDNMGVDDLRLVKGCDPLSPGALQTAVCSHEILRGSRIYPSLKEAVSDRQIVLGTTARLRDRQARIARLGDIHELAAFDQCDAALVYGRESSGLTNTEIAVCNAWIHITTFGTNRSLNLSHAVMVTLYELSRQYVAPPERLAKGTLPAVSAEVERLKKHLFRILDRIRFLRLGQRDTMWSSFSDLAGRTRLTDRDVRMIRGFLNKVEVTLDRAKVQGERASTPARKP